MKTENASHAHYITIIIATKLVTLKHLGVNAKAISFYNKRQIRQQKAFDFVKHQTISIVSEGKR